jgi:hypothetical protein
MTYFLLERDDEALKYLKTAKGLDPSRYSHPQLVLLGHKLSSRHMNLRARPTELARCPSTDTEHRRWTDSSTCFSHPAVSLERAAPSARGRVERGSAGLPLIATGQPGSVELGGRGEPSRQPAEKTVL